MKNIPLLFLLFVSTTAFAQFPDNPIKLRLGYQTSAKGLIYYGNGTPTNDPTGYNADAFAYIDTLTNTLYLYDVVNDEWEFLVDSTYLALNGGGGGGVADGVITGAVYNAGTKQIDVSVASPGTSFSFSVSALLDNTDTQDLSFVGTTLSLTDGGSVDLSSLQDGTGTDDQTAAEVSVTPAGNLTSTDVQNALEELQTDIDGLGGGGTADGVATSGTYNAGTKNIDITVASPGSNFSIDVSALLDNTDAQVISLDGNTLNISGNVSAVDLSPYLDNTDAQAISLAGTILSITGSASTVDLSVIQDGTGTDDQTASEVPVTPIGNLNSTDVQAALEEHQADIDAITGGGGVADGVITGAVYNAGTKQIDVTVAAPGSSFSFNVSALLDNTDAQDLSLDGTTLSLTGDATPVDLSIVQDGTGTDDQVIDVFSITGNTLSLSIEDDGEATKTVDLSGLTASPNFDYIQLNTAFDNQDFAIGEMGWDETGAFRFGVEDNYSFAVGQDMYKEVHNTTAEPISAGTAVMMTGADGNSNVFTVAPMNYPTIGSEYLIGIAANDILAGGYGVAVQNGYVKGIDVDAAGWSAGDVLYLSETSAGQLTTTVGDVLVAAVTKATSNGSIYVRPDFYATNELQSLTWDAGTAGNDEITLSDGGGTITITDDVDDADADPANEIQNLQSVTDEGATTTNPVILAGGVTSGANGGVNGFIKLQSNTGPSGTLSAISQGIRLRPDPGGGPVGFINIDRESDKQPTILLLDDGTNIQMKYADGGTSGDIVIESGSSSNGSTLTLGASQSGPRIVMGRYGNIGSPANLRFNVFNTSTEVEDTKMILTTSGQLGIGTITPTTLLDVNGTAKIGGVLNLQSVTQDDTEANVLVLQADGEVRYRDVSTIVSGTDDQTAAEVSYNNATSGLTADDVQAAIDEIEARVDLNDAKVTNTDNQVLFFNSETNILSIQSANYVDLSPLAAGGGLTWDDQSIYNNVSATTLDFATYSAANSDVRNFNFGLTATALTADPDAILNLPADATGYEEYIITVSCDDNGANACIVNNLVDGTYTMLDGELLVIKAANKDAGVVWFYSSSLGSGLPNPQVLSWSAGLNGDDEITLSDGGGTITITDNVDDADADPTNEIQSILLGEDDLLLISGSPSSNSADLSKYLDNTDAQTLGVSGDDITLTNGGSVSVINTVSSITPPSSTSISVDLGNARNRVLQIDMTTASTSSTVTLSVSNAVSGGVYTFHLQNTQGTHDLDFPLNFYKADGTQWDGGGTVNYTADDWLTCYFDGTIFYCK